ncbi:MAG: AbiV family abortive infection protein [Gemmatimonadota bacterium]
MDPNACSLFEALTTGASLIGNSRDVDRASEHIFHLLTDAYTLYGHGSYATAAFLAITAFEETAKSHIAMYRAVDHPVKRGKDPLLNHGKKHLLGALPSIAMGTRLGDALGQARVEQLLAEARGGRLVALREAALYVVLDTTGVRVPADVVTRERARELILFAIEAFDDALIGYTARSFETSKRTDTMFAALAG